MRPAETPSSPGPDSPAAPNPPTRVLETARSIAAAQLPSGAIAWPDGHVDPWDHVECAMALSACGLTEPARRAYQWLCDTQREDGSWPRTTVGATVTDPAAEAHHAAYAAVGVWHEYVVTGNRGFTGQMWPAVRRATDWVLGLQTRRGEVAWERDAAGRPGDFALLSGCSSILHGLRCAIALADLVGEPQPEWELAAVRLGHVLACHPEAFADKSRFAMDWYYPVLGGALRGGAAARRLTEGWNTFVVPGLGARCVSDQPWVTVAETCELVLALDACGLSGQATELFGAVHRLRHDDGSYWTGWQFRNAQYFPAERSSWTAAAVILAADALTGFSAGSSIFRDAPAPRLPGDVRPAESPRLDGADACPPADPEACGCAPASADAVAGSL
jgi:MMP endo-(1,4)-3-O-methyl-alpha-D-mannosidase